MVTRVSDRLSRRAACAHLALVVTGLLAPRAARATGGPAITVYKSPTCGCCTAWVAYMKKAGFAVTAHDTEDVDSIKAQLGVRPAFGSCHTAVVGRYVVEGHVPADVVTQLLREKPDALGVAVPGMPMGSPGMDSGVPERYDVLLLSRDGKSRVYARR